MRDEDAVFAEAGVDPIVLALALALTARRPVALFAGAGEASAGRAGATPATVTAPRGAFARSPRPKNRKG